MQSVADLVPAILQQEVVFQFARSSGPGGQHVNKTSTKAVLRWNVVASAVLQEETKVVVLQKLATRLTKEGELVLSAQEMRSQADNKDAVVAKLTQLLTAALARRKKRKATKPSKSSVQKRLTSKKKQSEKKQWRRGE